MEQASQQIVEKDNMFYFSSGNTQYCTTEQVKKLKQAITNQRFTSFDEYKDIMCKTYRVCYAAHWLDSTCTCPAFQKNKICKHTVGVAAIHKAIRIPIEAKSVQIGEKPKRGRRPKAVKALEVQPREEQPTTSAATSTILITRPVTQPKKRGRPSNKELAERAAASKKTRVD